ncbi:PROTEIN DETOXIFICATION 55 [Salix koriyanagi]|uniref:PROTEIN DETOXIFICATION 55 n=1 Tax=Salix koriyanagi TaxID=2511006 RepID=A0A9Q0WP86_9ROSI|nr:PROTEIN DETOXIFICATION 55 [Salix koriyanagi]
MVTAEKSHKYPTMPEVVEELKKMTEIGFPIAALSLVGYLKNMILVVCMGRLGSLELAGGALAIGFTNISGYSVLSGLATGMEPLCSQAFGSRNLLVASHTLRRTILMLLLASIPIGLLWVNLEPLLLSLHQDPDITRIASLYCRFSIPDLIANSLLHPLRIYLRSKGTTWPLMWCTLVSIVLHVPVTLFLAFTLSLGVPGIAISTFITNFNTLLFLVCYMYLFSPATATVEEPASSAPLITQQPFLSSPSTSLRKEWGNSTSACNSKLHSCLFRVVVVRVHDNSSRLLAQPSSRSSSISHYNSDHIPDVHIANVTECIGVDSGGQRAWSRQATESSFGHGGCNRLSLIKLIIWLAMDHPRERSMGESFYKR